MSDYNYGPIEHELAGGTSAEDDYDIDQGRIQFQEELTDAMIRAGAREIEPPALRAGQGDWTLSKPLTNQILADDLRRGVLATSIYGIDIPEDAADRIHFGAVIVFGNDERAAQIVTEHNQHATMIEQREQLSRAAYRAITRMEDLSRYLEKNDASTLGGIVAECLADLSVAIPAELLATIEQEGEA